jgi:hypothetical protein
MEIRDGAPDIRRGATIVDKESVVARPSTRKFDPLDPSSTLLPLAWLTLIASSPEPVWMKTFGTFAVTLRWSVVGSMNSHCRPPPAQNTAIHLFQQGCSPSCRVG